MITRLFPTRSERINVKIVSDLDALTSQPIGFKFQGTTYVIEPVDTQAFMKIAQGLQSVQTILKNKDEGKDISFDEVYEAYYGFIKPICKQITLGILKSMTPAQINALVGLILKHMTGTTASDMQSSEVNSLGEKKNSMK